MLAQGLLAGDDAVLRHDLLRRVLPLAHVEPHAHPSPQGLPVVDLAGEAARLIGRQGIHGVDDDGLAPQPRPPGAVVQDGQAEALGLAGARARGHQGRVDRGLEPHRRSKARSWWR
jgi:hypothetical protein